MNQNERSLSWLVTANSLTTSRLLIAFYILFWSPIVEGFLYLVIAGGITDILDGLAARQGGQSRGGGERQGDAVHIA